MSRAINLRALFFGLLFSSIIGCSTANYYPPTVVGRYENSVTINAPKDSVWKTFIAALSKEFFVINNLDKDTGLVNVSYSGDPTAFVDCGMVQISGASGNTTFAGAAPRAQYVRFVPFVGMMEITRTVDLDGRANLLLQDIDPNTTRVTANVRYLLTRIIHVRSQRGSDSDTQRINFNSQGSGMIGSNPTVICRPTGEFEQRLLALAGPSNVQQGPVSASIAMEVKTSLPAALSVAPLPIPPTIAKVPTTIEIGRIYQATASGLTYSPQLDFSKKIDLSAGKAFRILERISVWNNWVYQIELPGGERGFIKEQDVLAHLKAGQIEMQDAKR